MELSGWGGILDGVCGTGCMHPFLVLGMYMYLGMCCGIVYDSSTIYMVDFAPFHACIYVSGWVFSCY